MIDIPNREQDVTDEQVLASFDLSLPNLKLVQQAVKANDIVTAKKNLVDYFHTRTNVKFLFDYRGAPLLPMDPDKAPYSYQSSLGFQGSLKEFCLKVGKKMMDNIYVLPGADRGEVDLGANFENMIHFDFIQDQGKRHRHKLDMFVRGQFFESMAVLYHENGDKAVADKFKVVINQFFKAYPLQVIDGSAKSNRFQYDEDRDVMSVGWLCMVFISLFYTELPYAVDFETAFEIIKRIWFLGIQFRRFDNDGYRPYNHHMWERGLVPFILGTLLPEITDFVAMRDKGAAVVCRHVKEDFNKEGGYNEHSIAYWAGAAVGEMIYRGVYIARLNNIELLDDDAAKRIYKTFDVLASISPPTKSYPSLGDNRGPMIDPILRLGVMMVNNIRCKELLVVRAKKKIADESVIPLDYCNDKTGFACMRSDYTDKANYFLMSVKKDCGSSGHNHMDMLSLFVTIKGESIFGEPYSGKLYHTIRMGSLQRGYMYNMQSHNTVLAYGQAVAPDTMYCNKWGVYRSDSPVSEFVSNVKGAYLDAYHTGYTSCRHRRKLLFARKGAAIIKDDIERGSRMEAPHIQRWHLEPYCTIKKLSNAAIIIEKNGVKVLCIWDDGCKVIIKDNSKILCPAIYESESELAPIIDVEFSQPVSSVTDLLTVSLNMLMLDITDRLDFDIDNLQVMLQFLSNKMDGTDTLTALSEL